MPNIITIDLGFLDTPNAIAAFLIETSEGPVLVETGPHSTLPQLEAAINANGYTSQDIKKVFLTHIHLDHAGAAWYFARLGATIYVHPRGLRHLASPEKLMSSARMIYKEEMDTLWGEMHPIEKEKLIGVEDQDLFTFGDFSIKAHHTPGHAVHHIAWQLEDQLFAGDVAGVKIANGPVMPPCPPPDIHIEDWQQSIANILQLEIKTLHLTHFGEIHSIREHFGELENHLLAWANWIKPHFDQGTAQEIITPQFQKYVADQLRVAGVKEAGRAQYEAANPAWMSVAGLMRYWKIKTRFAT